ncbi:uncharacterized protein LOC111709644, partial [Eurytemora carolleeae]|uniref:uncharacterized protein LOC111709644 n=1 Tax=Eurytemora carolleeae TaxID=1294199 RepID=UPI000C782D99
MILQVANYYQPRPLIEVKTDNVKTEELNLISILCHSTNLGEKEDMRQFRQVVVMLKSAVLFTQRKLNFHIIVNDNNTFFSIVQTANGWPEFYRSKLVFSLYNIWYPK